MHYSEQCSIVGAVKISAQILKSIVVGIFILLIFTTIRSQQLAKYAIICPVTEILRKNTTAWKCLKNWLKYGISWQIKEGKYNDKSIIHLPRQESGFQSINW